MSSFKLSLTGVPNQVSSLGKLLFSSQVSSNGAPWARPGAMPRGPKWGVLILRPPKKRAQGQLPIFYFLT